MRDITVVVSDAGAAQILLSLVEANRNKASWHIIVPKDSPAFSIALKKALVVEPLRGDEEIESDYLFYGTSWQNSFHEHFVIRAKEKGIKSIAFLDNWEGYARRFGAVLPDFFAVSDDLAYTTAKDEGLQNILKVRDYATLRFLDDAKKYKIEESNRVLILSEPTAKVAKQSYADANYWGFTESSWLRDILDHFGLFHVQSVVIRLHPSDSAEQYKEIFKEYKIAYEISQNRELIEDLLSCSLVVGINTVALYYASLLNRKAISYIPSQNRSCNLPIAKQNRIQSFENFDISSFKYNVFSEIDDFGLDFITLLERLDG